MLQQVHKNVSSYAPYQVQITNGVLVVFQMFLLGSFCFCLFFFFDGGLSWNPVIFSFLLSSLLVFLSKLIRCAFILKINDFFFKESLKDLNLLIYYLKFFRNSRLSKLIQHHDHLQSSHSKYFKNYAITDAIVSQCFTKLIE